jgi:hypothetical protein
MVGNARPAGTGTGRRGRLAPGHRVRTGSVVLVPTSPVPVALRAPASRPRPAKASIGGPRRAPMAAVRPPAKAMDAMHAMDVRARAPAARIAPARAHREPTAPAGPMRAGWTTTACVAHQPRLPPANHARPRAGGETVKHRRANGLDVRLPGLTTAGAPREPETRTAHDAHPLATPGVHPLATPGVHRPETPGVHRPETGDPVAPRNAHRAARARRAPTGRALRAARSDRRVRVRLRHARGAG